MQLVYEFYVVKCAWCNKQLEINGTTDLVLMGQTSHGICEPCNKLMLPEQEPEYNFVGLDGQIYSL